MSRWKSGHVHRDVVVAVRYSVSGGLLATADQSGDIRVWADDGSRELARTRSSHPPVTGLWFSEDEQTLFAGHQSGHLIAFSPSELKVTGQVQLVTPGGRGLLAGTSRPILDWVMAVVCPREGEHLYVTLEYRDFFVVRKDNLQVVSHEHLDGNVFGCSATQANGRLVFFGDDLGGIFRLALPDMGLAMVAEHRESVKMSSWSRTPTGKSEVAIGIAGLAISPDGKLLASTSREGGVQIWSIESLESAGAGQSVPLEARPPTDNSQWLRGVAFLPDASAVALGGDDGAVEVWNYQQKVVTHEAKLPQSVRALDVSPRGTEFAVGCEDGHLALVPLIEAARFNWLLVLFLSGFGLTLGLLDTRGFLLHLGTPVMTAVTLVLIPMACAVLIGRNVTGLYFVHGFIVGALSWASAAAVVVLEADSWTALIIGHVVIGGAVGAWFGLWVLAVRWVADRQPGLGRLILKRRDRSVRGIVDRNAIVRLVGVNEAQIQVGSKKGMITPLTEFRRVIQERLVAAGLGSEVVCRPVAFPTPHNLLPLDDTPASRPLAQDAREVVLFTLGVAALFAVVAIAGGWLLSVMSGSWDWLWSRR